MEDLIIKMNFSSGESKLFELVNMEITSDQIMDIFSNDMGVFNEESIHPTSTSFVPHPITKFFKNSHPKQEPQESRSQRLGSEEVL